MKLLLLPLIAVLALPTALISRDLGKADFDSERVMTKKEIFEELHIKDKFDFNCGSLGTHLKKCVIEFKEEKLIVDNSIGIIPSQVKHLYEERKGGAQGIYLSLLFTRILKANLPMLVLVT